jgi:hypothetical protein
MSNASASQSVGDKLRYLSADTGVASHETLLPAASASPADDKAV